MAKILYGVQGDSFGHVSRARTIAQCLPENEFMFVGGKTVHDLESDGFSVVDVPVLDTFYQNNRVDNYRTLKNGLRILKKRGNVVRSVSGTIRHFNPDVILTDYEYFTAAACQRLGRPCISLDHQHILTHCAGRIPGRQYLNGLMTKALIKGFFSKATHFLIVSFFGLPPLNPKKTEVFSALVNHAVTKARPVEGDHVLVYLTTATFYRIIPVLDKMDHPFIIYGFGALQPHKNLVFKSRSREGFIEDLASCRYVIANGGHNTISEALYLRKPVFSFPICNAYEQFANAYYLRELGYGAYATDLRFARHALDSFEKQLDSFTEKIRGCFVTGNRQLIHRLKTLIGGE